ncbi:MAG TPA: hypothetical protein VGQ69_03740 [Gemmatimonadales bacterium]|jgi:hypothetical protein|nr:hypothetical protein [Gemmatimonadales bacterium]
MTEDELVRTASRLGDQAVRDLDGGRLARTVLARLATEPVVSASTHFLRRSWLVGLAPAAALLLVLRLTLGGGPAATTSSVAAPATLSVLHELDELSAAELEVLLEILPPATDSAGHPDAASFDELDVKSLERLLRSLEG